MNLSARKWAGPSFCAASVVAVAYVVTGDSWAIGSDGEKEGCPSPFLIPACFYVPCCGPSSDKIYIQTRRFAANKVREVVTRDDDDGKLVFPSYRDVTVVWEPNDSKHRGKLFLQHELKGEPEYVEFRPSEDTEPEWYEKLQKVWADLRKQYGSSNTFYEERVSDWEEFWARFPWKGLRDLPPEHKPAFAIPCFPTEPVAAEGRELAVGLLSQTGLDPDGNRRAFFKDGQDQMAYPKSASWVTYGNYLLSGERYHPANKGKRPFKAGKLRRRRRRRGIASGMSLAGTLSLELVESTIA